MDAGRFIEDGPPRELMESKDGAFYQLCVKDGLIKEESIV
jgi:ABC-type multidrug transport system fused ATPase/permease subunit